MPSSPLTKSKYRRVILKLSGEVLQNTSKGLSIDPDVISHFAQTLKSISKTGVQIAIVIGGGEYFQGSRRRKPGNRPQHR